MKKAATIILFTIQWASIDALDWPTYRHDAQRTGITSEQLALPLSKSWTFVSTHQPERAWPAPFRENPYSGVKVEPLLTFDHAFQPIACGNSVFFGSSSDHQLYCLDLTSGRIKWTFYTEGPVRICPTFHQERLYFGSDDGIIYCLDAQTGHELWRHLAGPSNDKIPGNEQIVSRWPVRSGVLVEKGLVYSAAGLFPAREGSYLFALDAYDGKNIWKKKINQTAQGYLLATPSKIFVPSGKLTPLTYNRANGDYINRISGPRGNFALIVDDVMVSGPGISGGNLVALDQANKQYRVANFKANKAVISSNSVFLASGTEVIRRDRKPFVLRSLEKRRNDLLETIQTEKDAAKSETLKAQLKEVEESIEKLKAEAAIIKEWKQPVKDAKSIILAGNTLFVGREHEVLAIHASTGSIDWNMSVDGVVHGIVAANGFLLATTDKGRIYCFAEQGIPQQVAESSVSTKQRAGGGQIDYFDQDFSRQLLGQLDQRTGYALVHGVGDAQLASQILRDTNFNLVCMEEDSLIAAKTRDRFNEMGQYGKRIVVHKKMGNRLPYPDFMFNFICVDIGALKGKELLLSEYYRLLRPFGTLVIGGTKGASDSLALAHKPLADLVASSRDIERKFHSLKDQQWHVINRGELPGSGEWSHQYADPGNTACSEDMRISGDLRLQWYGKPGPYRMFDRHSYTTAPVYSSGRLFTLGEKILYANDAYNGRLLWEKELPSLEPRVNLPRDCGYMVTDRDHVYLAIENNCIKVNARSGKTETEFNCPKIDDDHDYNWGYVATTDGLLFGSSVRSGNFYTEGRGPWYDDSGFNNAKDSHKVLSDCLFAVDLAGNSQAWKYNGVIINSTIAIGGDQIYFVENRNPKVLQDKSRRLSGGKEWMALHLVALDVKTGKMVWDKDMQFEQRTPVFFSTYKDGTLIVLRSSPKSFDLRAIDAKSGKPLWNRDHGWENNHHGAHRRHPVIIGDVVYQQPLAYDLKTGKEKWSTSKVGVGGNCGTLSASSSMLFSRLSNYPGFIDLGKGMNKENLVEITRPGCWINIIPVGGMVLVPEAGSGCSCEYSIHASMGFLPRKN
jgi:outer membrane protein assembly factor BamB